MWSKKTTNYYIKKGLIDSQEQKAYEYGFEVLLSTLIYILLFLFTAIITKTVLFSVFWILGFFIVRTISGGYHASTHLTCNIISIICQIVFISLIKNTPISAEKYVILALLLLSSLIIITIAPIEHPNKPFIKTERKRYRITSVFYAILIIVILLIYLCFFIKKTNLYFLSFAIGNFTATISLIVAKIKY